MTNKKLGLTFILCFFFSTLSNAYIDSLRVITLTDNRQIFVLFDAYEGYARYLNQSNAATIALAIKNFALRYSTESIDFSFEDPSVYDVGKGLIPRLAEINQTTLFRVPADQFLALVPPASRVPFFDLMSFTRPKKLTTLLAGDLTSAFALVTHSLQSTQTQWPNNLTIRSNDPRREHFLALTKSKLWLTEHSNTIRMKDLITASPLLKDRREMFDMDDRLDQEQTKKLESIFDEMAATEQAQLDAFANFATLKLDQKIDPADLDRTLQELGDKIPLDMVHEFLMETKKQTDIYSNAPIVDILLAMFNQQHPDKMMIVLGNHLAKRLITTLHDLKVVNSDDAIEDPIFFISELARNQG